MKTKDLVYIGLIAYLSYLLLRKRPFTQTSQSTIQTTGTTSTNIPNGGLNLGDNMDLPNLTPTPSDGLSTEVALNNSNVSPLIQDNNEPTQIFGNYNLPTPYTGGSVINPSPTDVVASSQETLETGEPLNPIQNHFTTASSVINTPASSQSNPMEDTIASASPRQPKSGIITPTDLPSGTSIVSEPTFVPPTKTTLVDSPNLGVTPIVMPEPVKDELISQCGNSFSIPNNDKEASYTNYWYSNDVFYMQSTSPLTESVPVKITKEQFVEGCKKFQLYQLQNTTKR